MSTMQSCKMVHFAFVCSESSEHKKHSNILAWLVLLLYIFKLNIASQVFVYNVLASE